MRRRMAVAAMGEDSLEFRAQARRLVDGQLFLDGKMQAQVQKRIHGALFDRKLTLRRRIEPHERRLILRVDQNDVDSEPLHRRERRARAVFLP